jgi:endonuclease/exonuclease/phosphatase family metal-dependent hydrolase
MWFQLWGALAGAVAVPQAADTVWHELGVATFNVRYDNPADTLRWADRHREVAAAVAGFDLIGFQEVLPHQLDDLRADLPHLASFGTGREADGSGEASPVFWNPGRLDFLGGEVRWLAPDWNVPGTLGWTATLPRVATVCSFYDRHSGRMLRVISTHWCHESDEARRGSAGLIAGWTGWDEDAVAIVLGDLNAPAEAQEVQELMEFADLKDVYAVAKYRCRPAYGTFSTFLPAHLAAAPRIDHILVRGARVNWTCADEHIKWGVYISDHLPVHAILEISEK